AYGEGRPGESELRPAGRGPGRRAAEGDLFGAQVPAGARTPLSGRTRAEAAAGTGARFRGRARDPSGHRETAEPRSGCVIASGCARDVVRAAKTALSGPGKL